MIETLIGWLILAQTVRWAHPWITAMTWAMFGGLAVGWAWRRRCAALRAVWRSPLLPVAGAAALSAAINGGGWSRVADWALYAACLAWLLDQRPDLDQKIVGVGRWVSVICLFEFAGLVLAGGDLGWRVHLLGNSNVIAALLLIGLLREPDRRWWAVGGLAVLATGCRAGILSLVLYALLRARRWTRWTVVGLAGAGAALTAIRPGGTLHRIIFWQQAIQLFLSRPVVGVGPGLASYAGWPHAHNLIMSALAEGGLLALAAWALAGWRAWRGGWRPGPLALAVAPFFTVDDMTMYWLVSLGVLYLVSKEVHKH